MRLVAYVNIPRDVMQGYTVMVAEILQQLPDSELPTHVFLQGGVGGLAAAFVAHLWEARGSDRPIVVVVEPDCADARFYPTSGRAFATSYSAGPRDGSRCLSFSVARNSGLSI